MTDIVRTVKNELVTGKRYRSHNAERPTGGTIILGLFFQVEREISVKLLLWTHHGQGKEPEFS